MARVAKPSGEWGGRSAPPHPPRGFVARYWRDLASRSARVRETTNFDLPFNVSRKME